MNKECPDESVRLITVRLKNMRLLSLQLGTYVKKSEEAVCAGLSNMRSQTISSMPCTATVRSVESFRVRRFQPLAGLPSQAFMS